MFKNLVTTLMCVIVLIAFNECTRTDDSQDSSTAPVFYNHSTNNPEPNTKQVLVALPDAELSSNGILFGFEFLNSQWHLNLDTIRCSFGRNGIADSDEKLEGDGKTPSGIYYLGSAFGYRQDLVTEMPFIELSDTHFWVSDKTSELYNRLVDYHPGNVYAEKMKRSDHLYKYGIIIEYNTTNTIKGKGSAIFLHVWRKEGASTAGCIGVSEMDMKHLIEWLKPENKPKMIISASPDFVIDTSGLDHLGLE